MLTTTLTAPEIAVKSKIPRSSIPQEKATSNSASPKVVSRQSDDNTQTSTALVLYRPVFEEFLKPARHRLLRLELLVLLTLTGFGFFAWRTLAQEQTVNETNRAQGRSLLKLSAASGNEHARVDKLTHFLDGITMTVAQTTARMDQLSTKLEVEESKVDSSMSEVRGIEAILRNRHGANPHVTDIRTPAPGGPSRPVSPGASLSNPHVHQIDTAIQLPNGSHAHQDLQGQTDYWMVRRMFPEGERVVKVQPYGTSALGIQVHSIDDGMDYILTPQGGWLEGLADR